KIAIFFFVVLPVTITILLGTHWPWSRKFGSSLDCGSVFEPGFIDLYSDHIWFGIGVLCLFIEIFLIARFTRLVRQGGIRPSSISSYFMFSCLCAGLLIIAFVALGQARDKGFDSGVKGNLAGLRVQMELYFDDHGKYPAVIGDNPVERWIKLGKEARFSFSHDCYQQTQNPNLEFDYRNSPAGDRWVAFGYTKGFRWGSNGEVLNKWCVDFTGYSGLAPNSFTGDIFACPRDIERK
ncbi:hypothetical protein HY469_03470, partial [Candidatus Roizmanbacteria bacterium]|nr:hypothetical protein [Candidatus Roizmanbacteria bacterium]